MPKSPTRPTQYPSPQWARALHRGKPRHSCRGGRPVHFPPTSHESASHSMGYEHALVLLGSKGVSTDVASHHQQLPLSPSRNGLPVKLIDWSCLMLGLFAYPLSCGARHERGYAKTPMLPPCLEHGKVCILDVLIDFLTRRVVGGSDCHSEFSFDYPGYGDCIGVSASQPFPAPTPNRIP